MRRAWIIGPASVVLSAFMWVSEAAGTEAAPGACRSGDPLANVRAPSRLKVRSACQTASGVVRLIRKEGDGDILVLLAPDPASARLLNAQNRGKLWVEIVPADQPGCVAGKAVRYGTCTGAHLPAPPVGSRVTVTGPYVVDTAHGHTEIHPAWRIARR